jgi:hypothetical protein
MSTDLVEKHQAALRELTDAGYAIVIFSPDELGNDIDPIDLESRLIEVGWNYIDSMSYHEESENE